MQSIWVISSPSREGEFRGLEKIADHKIYLARCDAETDLKNMSPVTAPYFKIFELYVDYTVKKDSDGDW